MMVTVKHGAHSFAHGAKINQDRLLTLQSQNYVVGLDISMNHALIMNKVQYL